MTNAEKTGKRENEKTRQRIKVFCSSSGLLSLFGLHVFCFYIEQQAERLTQEVQASEPPASLPDSGVEASAE